MKIKSGFGSFLKQVSGYHTLRFSELLGRKLQFVSTLKFESH